MSSLPSHIFMLLDHLQLVTKAMTPLALAVTAQELQLKHSRYQLLQLRSMLGCVLERAASFDHPYLAVLQVAFGQTLELLPAR